MQIDGVAMGSPLAPILADFFMNNLFDNCIYKQNDKYYCKLSNGTILELLYFTRYVDDTFAAVNSEEDARLLLDYFNTLHNQIEITIETEFLGKIPFLDLWIYKTDEGIELGVYRKLTHSGVFTHFSSFVPFRFKIQLINTLLSRAYQICSTATLLEMEISRILNMLKSNGYNEQFVNKFINIFKRKQQTVQQNDN